MTDRRKSMLMIAALLGIMVIFFAEILFTNRIVRAPDIINEYYWTVLRVTAQPFSDMFNIRLFADWDIYNNSGNTLEGGGLGNQFLIWQRLLYHLISPPASVAWFMVLHLFVGGAGVYCCCRAAGTSRTGALLGGLVFALSTEMVSLINAGHVLKIATISIAPWAFFLLERGFQTRRAVWFMGTGLVLAVQFFYTHWQIAYYTCLCVGIYGLASFVLSLREPASTGVRLRLLCLNLVVLAFFLSSVAIDLMPLANWSTATTRGAQSGSNQGKGGLDREEAMSWSLPPEELGSLVIPGMLGFSRQEAGENPPGITSYYWGRMVFTQTASYFGLLPLVLLPLPLIFRRDRITWLAFAGIVGCLLFSMGKYTPFYNWLFDHFPGINRFRVPKMIMFIPAICFGVLAARGLDLARDQAVRGTAAFRRYLFGVAMLPVFLLLLLGVEYFGRDRLINLFFEMLAQPTRYEEGPQLVVQRWNNLIAETAIAAAVAAGCSFVLALPDWRRQVLSWMPLFLLAVYLLDVGRVNRKFLFLVDVPKETSASYKTQAIDFLSRQSKEYRVLPLVTGPGPYSSQKIPVMFIPMPVQQKRWQDFLDNFSLMSPMPDILNVKYLILPGEQFAREKNLWEQKYSPVLISSDSGEVVLENRTVMPKAWLVPRVVQVDPSQALAGIQNPAFDPRSIAFVETPPPLPMAAPPTAAPALDVRMLTYEGERIKVAASTSVNALLVLGEKFYRGWKATVDSAPTEIHQVDYLLRGVYLPPGNHTVEFRFDPLPFKIGKYLTLSSFVLFAGMLIREWLVRRKRVSP